MGENALNNAKLNTILCDLPSLREGEKYKTENLSAEEPEFAAAVLFPRNAPGHLAAATKAHPSYSAPSQIALHSDSIIPQYQKRKPPQFEKYVISPQRYLKNLEQYFRDSKVTSVGVKFYCIGSGLKGHASDWFDYSKLTFTTYDDFKNQFLAKFWSQKEQQKYKRLLFTENYQSQIKNESLSDFFHRQLTKSLCIFPDLSFKEILLKFAVKLPNEYATLLITRNAQNVEELGTFIKDLDCLNKYKEIDDSSSTKTVKRKRKRLRRRKSKPVYNVECRDLESTSSCKNVNNVQYFNPQNKPVQVWDCDKYYGNVQSTSYQNNFQRQKRRRYRKKKP